MMSNWIKYVFGSKLLLGSYVQHIPGEVEGTEKQKTRSLLLGNAFEE